MSGLRGAWSRYNALLQSGGWRALLAKSLTSAVIMGGGDIACQLLVEQVPQQGKQREALHLDGPRAGRFVILGAVLVAPVLHTWYDLLARSVIVCVRLCVCVCLARACLASGCRVGVQKLVWFNRLVSNARRVRAHKHPGAASGRVQRAMPPQANPKFPPLGVGWRLLARGMDGGHHSGEK